MSMITVPAGDKISIYPQYGAIPWAHIDRWARRHGIKGEEFDVIERLVTELDRVWLKAAAEKAK